MAGFKGVVSLESRSLSDEADKEREAADKARAGSMCLGQCRCDVEEQQALQAAFQRVSGVTVKCYSSTCNINNAVGVKMMLHHVMKPFNISNLKRTKKHFQVHSQAYKSSS